MKGSFDGGRREKDGVIVLSAPAPQTCGGTYATQDTRAKKEIVSEDMIFFSVTSQLPWQSLSAENGAPSLRYVSAFAAPCGDGEFLFLETASDRQKENTKRLACVKAGVFPALVRLVREKDLAKDNGFHSRTHGLPEDFGGSVDIRYASGENISFSDNQSPVIDAETGAEIVRIFSEAMGRTPLKLPDLSHLCGISFEETRENGGFTKAALTLLPDGGGIDRKQSRYDEPKVYESEKPVDAFTVAQIKRTVEENRMLAWSGLPSGGFSTAGNKRLTFAFDDGTAVAVQDGRLLPDRLSHAFFEIELELTVKH